MDYGLKKQPSYVLVQILCDVGLNVLDLETNRAFFNFSFTTNQRVWRLEQWTVRSIPKTPKTPSVAAG
jgi:hypothetical protein